MKKSLKSSLAVGIFGISSLLIGCTESNPAGNAPINPANCRDAAGVNTTAVHTCDFIEANSGSFYFTENFEAACFDGLDNDLNDVYDATDPNCAAFYSVASSTIDPSSSSSSSSSVPPVSSTEPPTPSVYPFGAMPATANSAAMQTLYNNWINKYYLEKDDGTQARIVWDDPSATVSEGVAYGMLITVFQGDQDRFNKLAAYAMANLNGNGVISWKLLGFSGVHPDDGSKGGASDADLDAATALYIAWKKWGNQVYLDWAVQFAKNIWSSYFTYGFDVDDLICNSDVDCRSYNPSYFSPVAIRIFKEITPELSNAWDRVLAANYNVVIQSQANNSYGLFPNWSDEYGVPPIGGTTTPPRVWGLESVRVNWRLTWDYLWYGDERAKTAMNTFLNYRYAGGFNGDVLTTGQDYRLSNGQASKITNSPAFAGSFCLSGMVDAGWQGLLNDCYPKVIAHTGMFDMYFHTILQVMYTQMLTGLYTKP